MSRATFTQILGKAVLIGTIIALFIVAATIYLGSVRKINPKIAEIRLKNVTVQAEIAETEMALQKGLGGRAGLGNKEGMWFVFSTESKVGFWMRDMKFSIDIIWFDKDKKVVGIKEHAMPESYPEVFYPDRPARFVLEMGDGFVKKYGIKIGNQAEVVQ